MDKMIEQFPYQMETTIGICEQLEFNYSSDQIQNIYVSGMGGSGIGAAIIKEIVKSELKVPMEVGNSYDIPAYISEKTLFIASSYSGNTEETLHALQKALLKNAKIVCITSGGKLLELAESHQATLIKIPGLLPSPRACLGYSLIANLFVLIKLGLVKDEILQSLKIAISLIKYDQDELKNKAIRIAEILQSKTPVIYTETRLNAVATRIKQQLNENAKMHCWIHTIPEMNHNELVAWRQKDANLAVVFLRNKDDYSRNVLRIEYTKEVVSNYTDTIVDIYSKGKNLLEKSVYLIHLFDWVSYYLSVLRKVDPVEVRVIDILKSELQKHH